MYVYIYMYNHISHTWSVWGNFWCSLDSPHLALLVHQPCQGLLRLVLQPLCLVLARDALVGMNLQGIHLLRQKQSESEVHVQSL